MCLRSSAATTFACLSVLLFGVSEDVRDNSPSKTVCASRFAAGLLAEGGFHIAQELSVATGTISALHSFCNYRLSFYHVRTRQRCGPLPSTPRRSRPARTS